MKKINILIVALSLILVIVINVSSWSPLKNLAQVDETVGLLKNLTQVDETVPPQEGSKYVRTVTDDEYESITPCSFLDEGKKPANCRIEKPEHQLVKQYIQAGMAVLELGARYGTTTCAIAAQTMNSGKVVAVDPDYRVWKALTENLKQHNCSAYVHKGVVGTVERSIVVGRKYGTKTNPGHSKDSVPPLSLASLEKRIGQKFDAVMIDCEGCVNDFFAENPEAFDHFKIILMEGDMGYYGNESAKDCGDHCVDYNKAVKDIELRGFKLVSDFLELDGECPWIHHFAFKKIET